MKVVTVILIIIVVMRLFVVMNESRPNQGIKRKKIKGKWKFFKEKDTKVGPQKSKFETLQ